MLTSSRLAQTAGITVRTLRHYHAVGLLEEPPRGANGYRRYGVDDLVAVLRIRRMAALGLSLEQIRLIFVARSVGHSTHTDAELEMLETSLGEQIKRLEAQRAIIAKVRSLGADPDLPAELAPVFAVLENGSTDARSIEEQKQLAVLVAHLRPSDGIEGMRDLLTEMSTGDRLAVAETLSSRIHDLSDSDSTEVRASLLNDLVLFLEPITRVIEQRSQGWEDDRELQSIVESVAFGRGGMNAAQSALVRSVTQTLHDRGERQR